MSNAFRLTQFNTIVFEFDGYSLEIVTADALPKHNGAAPPREPPVKDAAAPPAGPNRKGAMVGGSKRVGRPPLDPGIIGFVLGDGEDVRTLPANLLTLTGDAFDVTLEKLRRVGQLQLRKLEQEARSRRGIDAKGLLYLDVGMRIDQVQQLDVVQRLGSIVTDNVGNQISGIRLIRVPKI